MKQVIFLAIYFPQSGCWVGAHVEIRKLLLFSSKDYKFREIRGKIFRQKFPNL